MTHSASKSVLVAIPMTSLLATGCIVVGGACTWGCSPTVWTESTETIAIDATDFAAMQVRTHNGAISFAGTSDGASGASVTVRKKVGGDSSADAEEALAALIVYSERDSGGLHKIGWKWSGARKSSWQAVVAFEISAPGRLDLDAETHNGSVAVAGLVGDARVVTHNGALEVETRDGSLDARTHNGRIVAAYEGHHVSLETHNGAITADLKRCGTVRGEMSTHNGSVLVTVGPDTSAAITARTDNGSIRHDDAVSVDSASRSRVEGKLGTGDGKLDLTTHNGQIQIKRQTG